MDEFDICNLQLKHSAIGCLDENLDVYYQDFKAYSYVFLNPFDSFVYFKILKTKGKIFFPSCMFSKKIPPSLNSTLASSYVIC